MAVEIEIKQVVVEQPPQPGRDPATGKFTKGNKFKPPTAIGGRHKKLDARPILDAIHEEFAPEEISAMLRKAYETALKVDDWKGQLEVVRFVAAYAIGKPVQRSIKATIEPEEFAKLFKGEDDDGAEADYIEAGGEA